jgi:hypothetical protein
MYYKVGTVSHREAMNAFLKEASDYDKMSVHQRNELRSEKSKNSDEKQDLPNQPAVGSPQKAAAAVMLQPSIK